MYLRYTVSTDSRPPAPAIRITRPYATEDEYLEREMGTLTRTGITLVGALPRPEGTILRFELALSSGQVVLRGEGRVIGPKPVSHDGSIGLALRFTRLDVRSKALVDRAAALREQAAHVSQAPPARESSKSTRASQAPVAPDSPKPARVSQAPLAPDSPKPTRVSQTPLAPDSPKPARISQTPVGPELAKLAASTMGPWQLSAGAPTVATLPPAPRHTLRFPAPVLDHELALSPIREAQGAVPSVGDRADQGFARPRSAGADGTADADLRQGVPPPSQAPEPTRQPAAPSPPDIISAPAPVTLQSFPPPPPGRSSRPPSSTNDRDGLLTRLRARARALSPVDIATLLAASPRRMSS